MNAFLLSLESRLAPAAPHVLRTGLVLLLVWFGLFKFTATEAKAILPLVEQSPLMFFLPRLLGTQGASNLIGVIELVIAALLIAGWRSPAANRWGALLGALTFATTLSFLLSSPSTWQVVEGLPLADGFLLKDLVLLGGCLALLRPAPQA